jgi:ABC-type polysaccharide/polyol phosphate export permease
VKAATRAKYGLTLDRNWISFTLHFLRQDLARQYDRTSLGVIWHLVGQTITISGIAVVFSLVFNAELQDFFPYLAISILSWNMISGIIGEAPRTYHSAGPILNSFPVPYPTFALRMVLRYFVTFAYGLPIYLAVALYFQRPIHYGLPLVLLNLPLLFLLLYPTANVIGILGARYRDVAPTLGSIIYLLFLVTPILFQPSQLPGRGYWLVVLNPLFYPLELLRRPFLGEIPGFEIYTVVLAMTVLAWVASAYFNKRYGRYLVFWV